MTEDVKASEGTPVEVPSDQWKRGGICAACRRRAYCSTQCSANRKYASVLIREYLRRRTRIDQIQKIFHEFGGDAE